MDNSFVNILNQVLNEHTYTENGSLAYNTTTNRVYDMFAVGAAYRNRHDNDCIQLFKNAFEEDRTLALKCLFFLRDCRGGTGERRFFRLALNWLAKYYPKIILKNIKLIPEYGRWDDLFVLFDTPLEDDMIEFIEQQFITDVLSKTPSLLAKWMPSENASSKDTIIKARKFIKAFGITAKRYRKFLVILRQRIKIVETLMSQNRWDEIEFDKIPSKAGLKYKNAFAHNDITKERYKAFIENNNTKINTKTLFPYEIVAEAVKGAAYDTTQRKVLEKMWTNLPDYCEGNNQNMLCVVDTSGSMRGFNAAAPINIAISLGMYCAERLHGPFKDNFITFSRYPQLIKITGADFVDKVWQIYRRNLCENTNLELTFDLLYKIACQDNVKKEDIPNTIIIISDMEIDEGANQSKTSIDTMMEEQRKKWTKAGLTLPRLIYWNVDARHNIFLDNDPNVTYVSGASPVLFKTVLAGKSGLDMMLDILLSDRYKDIQA